MTVNAAWKPFFLIFSITCQLQKNSSWFCSVSGPVCWRYTVTNLKVHSYWEVRLVYSSLSWTLMNVERLQNSRAAKSCGLFCLLFSFNQSLQLSSWQIILLWFQSKSALDPPWKFKNIFVKKYKEKRNSHSH